MKQPRPPSDVATLVAELHILANDVLHDFAQVYEHGLVQGKRGEGGGRPSGDADPTGTLAEHLFTDEEAPANPRRPSWRHGQANQALLDAWELMCDSRAKAEAAKRALFRPFRERGVRDPIKPAAPLYDGALGHDEHKRLEGLARERRARGEE